MHTCLHDINTGRCLGILLIILCTSCSTARHSQENGSPAADGTVSSSVHYGTGPGNTLPSPQTVPVDLAGVTGAKITNEKYSVRGNKDYKVLGKHYKVWRELDGYSEEGTASWYGPGFHGQKTSNGEHYNMNNFTAAHKNLPLPSFLKVTNLENGKTVIVRVNDRGPFHSNRILDLSKGAAAKIGVIGPGTARVRVELIKTVPKNEQTNMALMNGFKPYIQIFTTMDYNKALKIRNTIAQKTGQKAFIQNADGSYRVKVGPLTQSNADNTLTIVKESGYDKAFFTAD